MIKVIIFVSIVRNLSKDLCAYKPVILLDMKGQECRARGDLRGRAVDVGLREGL